MLRVDPNSLGPAAGAAAPDAADELALLRAALAETQDALRDSRRQYAHLLGNLSGIAYQCSLEAPWRMSFVSKGVEAITGYRAELLEQKKAWADIMHPADVAAVEAEVVAAIAARRAFTVSYRIVHRSGEHRWVKEQGKAVYDEGGDPLFLEGVISDASVEKVLELSLREAEAEARRTADQLSSALEATMDCVYSLDRDWRITYVNRRARDHLGEGEPLVGRAILDIFPDSRDTVFGECLRKAMCGGEAASAEGYLASREAWYELHATPVEGGITVFFRDISTRKRAEEVERSQAARLRTILDAVPQMLWAVWPNGDRYYSTQFRDFTGVPLGEPGAAQRIELAHPDDRERAAALWRNSLTTGEPYEAEYRLRHHSGDYRWILSRASPHREECGTIVAWYGTCTDIHERVLAKEALDAREREVRETLDCMPHIVWSMHAGQGRPDYYNQRWYEYTGLPEGSIGGAEWEGLFHPEDREAALERWRASRDTGMPYASEYRMRDRNGDYRWVISRARAVRNAAGEIVRWYGNCTDIHQRVLAREALNESERLNRGIIEASPDCVSVLDLDGKRLFVNQATLHAYGLDEPSRVIGRRWGSHFPESVRPRAEAALAGALDGQIARLLVQLEGERWWDIVLAPVRDEAGRPIRVVVISRDVTEQKLAEERAQWAANHDALTGLPNRILLQKRLDAAIDEARATGGGFGLLLLDVDDFKRINDTVGHDAGDALLCTFAERLRTALREDDTIARLGGDEFAVVLAGVRSEAGIRAAVDSILDRLREPCLFSGRLLDCQASIGASLFPDQGIDRTELLKNADIALYAAKGSGRANLRLFQPDMRAKMQKRMSMLSLARTALAENRILPFYQPQISMREGEIAGFEALLRWVHDRHGPQSPDTIAAAFEDLNLASDISDRMIDGVVEDVRRWRGEGIEFGHVAINAAAAEFRRGDFADKLLAKLDKAGVPPGALQVEVTETVFLGRGADFVERALKALSKAGVTIALDDFGTGFASLSHLQQFPVDIIKIDRSFLRDLHRDSGAAAIIDAVVNLGRSLGIKVVAEGIETEAQHDFLLSLGCDFGQGYLYGKAAPAADVAAMLDAASLRLAS